MYMRIHEGAEGSVVALCDEELLGRVLSDGKRRLDLKQYAGFYQGRRVSHQQAVEALRSAKNINLVGKKAMRAAAEAGIDVSAAVLIQSVPHLQAYRI
ncbi:MAG: DUF424 family protein [Candidatus Micrarchaeota archaeon]|nr:DUF424 family protein [Candidatus Micrarchaeota archaeon]